MQTSQPASAPKHVNHLIHSTSPYLLQHAHNPVDWYPWGPEALQRARQLDRPIFLSIGYSACHWCHVMERESFENEEIAAVLNRSFVSIKVDREERPDLDDLYMKATQLYNNGGGGWPMSVFLLPDGRPFFAGTYFPPESRWGRPGFRDLLHILARMWTEERAKIEAGAESLAQGVRQLSVTPHGAELIPAERVAEAAAALARAFDRQWGGIPGGGTNKFPPSMAMDLLLREHHRSLGSRGEQGGQGDPAAETPQSDYLFLVELTLEQVARGGIYDQLGGGIARYSTDERWLVPHFEKMLYDQALVSAIYLDAYQATHKALHARVAREILEYVIADLQSPDGGYCSARDADSEGEEGRYYVWSRAEVDRLLGPDAELFCSFYDVSQEGNWEGKNILHTPRDAETVARLHRIPVEELERRLASARRVLLAARQQRVAPALDDKVLASWNGLMIASMARGGAVLDDERFTRSAERAAAFVLRSMRRDDGRLLRTSRAGRSHTLAYLDDHAFLIDGLITLFEVTGRLAWLDEAEKLSTDVERYFADPAGGYFFTPSDGEALLVRAKDASDGAIPSGNSVHLMNLLRLNVLLDKPEYAVAAEKLMKAFSETARRSPYSVERLLAAVDFYWRRPREIAFVWPTGTAPSPGTGRDDARELFRAAWQIYVPNKVIAHLTVAAGTPASPAASACATDLSPSRPPEGQSPVGAMQAIARRIPLLADRSLKDGKPTAYVCRNFACQLPTNNPAELRRQLTPQPD